MCDRGCKTLAQQQCLQVFTIGAEKVCQCTLVPVMTIDAIYQANAIAIGVDNRLQQIASIPGICLLRPVVTGKFRGIDSYQADFASVLQMQRIPVVPLTDPGVFVDLRGSTAAGGEPGGGVQQRGKT